MRSLSEVRESIVWILKLLFERQLQSCKERIRLYVKLTLSGTFLTPMETPLCEAAYPTRGHRGPDSVFAALKLSFEQQLENP